MRLHKLQKLFYKSFARSFLSFRAFFHPSNGNKKNFLIEIQYLSHKITMLIAIVNEAFNFHESQQSLERKRYLHKFP
jgi:hypothetical protein